VVGKKQHKLEKHKEVAMENRIFVQKIVLVVFLIVIGVIIPMFSPMKLVLEPASFTLASHVPIFIAMFISPLATLAVAIGTALGFLIGGFPSVVVWRAASHLLFALLGSWYLQVRPQILSSFFKTQFFSFAIGIIHAWVEVTVVCFFYVNGDIVDTYYTTVTSVLLFVGLGSLLHGMVDFIISLVILKFLMARNALQPLFVTFQISNSV
jgi:niacin transporter